MEHRFNAVYRREGEWWAAYAEELPGAHTQGRTIEEARENLREAVALILEVNREIAAESTPGGEVVREELVVQGA
jgi:predicted RNase H-like HicB family nuclease